MWTTFTLWTNWNAVQASMSAASQRTLTFTPTQRTKNLSGRQACYLARTWATTQRGSLHGVAKYAGCVCSTRKTERSSYNCCEWNALRRCEHSKEEDQSREEESSAVQCSSVCSVNKAVHRSVITLPQLLHLDCQWLENVALYYKTEPNTHAHIHSIRMYE